jgi:hypothetical protein
MDVAAAAMGGTAIATGLPRLKIAARATMPTVVLQMEATNFSLADRPLSFFAIDKPGTQRLSLE